MSRVTDRDTRSRRVVASHVNVPGICLLLALAGIWELLVGTGVIHFRFLPAPSAIILHVRALVDTTPFYSATLHTVAVTIGGWACAGIVGVLVGTALGLSRVGWTWFMSSVDLLRALPAIALVPVAVVTFGFSYMTELSIVVYAAIWPVLVYTAVGITQVSEQLHDVGRTLGISRFDVARKITLPAAAQSVITGLRISLTLALVLAVVSEMVGNPSGLGYQLSFQQKALKPELMFGYVLTIGFVGVLLNLGLVFAVRRLAPNRISQ